MPEAEKTFILKAPAKDVWELFSNMEAVGSCIEGVEEVRVIDESSAEWRFKIQFGFITKIVHLRTKLLDQDPLKSAVFRGEGEDIDLTGRVELKPISDNETEIHYKMSIDGKGSLKRIIDMIVKTTIKQRTEDFAQRVEAKLTAHSF